MTGAKLCRPCSTSLDRGIVRVLNALFVIKTDDGTLSGVDIADLDADTVGDLTAFTGASTGLLSDDDVALVSAEIEPGSAAVMLVYENRWAKQDAQPDQQPRPAPSPLTPSAPAASQGGEDRIAQLEDLADLKAEGILTDEGFAAEKARILGR